MGEGAHFRCRKRIESDICQSKHDKLPPPQKKGPWFGSRDYFWILECMAYDRPTCYNQPMYQIRSPKIGHGVKFLNVLRHSDDTAYEGVLSSIVSYLPHSMCTIIWNVWLRMYTRKDRSPTTIYTLHFNFYRKTVRNMGRWYQSFQKWSCLAQLWLTRGHWNSTARQEHIHSVLWW